MHNTADDPAIIDARFPASVGRQMRRKPRELMIVQPEMISIHCRSSFGDLDGVDGPRPDGIALCQGGAVNRTTRVEEPCPCRSTVSELRYGGAEVDYTPALSRQLRPSL